MMNNSNYVKNAQRRKKEYAIDYYGGKCCICGYDKCINALEFHHLDRDEKEFKPSYIIMRWSFEKVKKELDKCILVCSNCHKEIHFLEKDVDYKKYIKKEIIRTCNNCSNIFYTKNEKQKFCSIVCSNIYNFSGKIRNENIPDENTLKKILEEKNYNFCAVGRLYSVSDNAIRKWCKKYNMLYKTSDWKGKLQST